MPENKFYKVLLFDQDDTLLSFQLASVHAFRALCEEFQIPDADQVHKRFNQINESYWRKLEQGQISLEELGPRRFTDLFEEYGLDLDPKEVSDHYFYQLSLRHDPMPDMEEVLKELRRRGKKIYVITNGVPLVQRKRFKESGLDQLTDGVFISAEMGYKKPDPRYFDLVLEELKVPRSEVLVIGDSLSSDIKGGVISGLDTCWITPPDSVTPDDLPINYRIAELKELLDLIR